MCTFWPSKVKSCMGLIFGQWGTIPFVYISYLSTFSELALWLPLLWFVGWRWTWHWAMHWENNKFILTSKRNFSKYNKGFYNKSVLKITLNVCNLKPSDNILPAKFEIIPCTRVVIELLEAGICPRNLFLLYQIEEDPLLFNRPL